MRNSAQALVTSAGTIATIPLEGADFDALRLIIYDLAGIHLRDEKKALVANRLARRIRARGLSTFGEYVAFVRNDSSGDEARELINCITTNKTSFFREPHHFDFLARVMVPEIVERARRTGQRKIRIWSAACSTGPEPWTIALVLREALGSFAGWDIRILASDLDTNVLRTAEEAAYDPRELDEVPEAMLRSGFERCADGRLRVVAPLRELVSFRRINLIERPWPIRTKFDAVFCRNVAIYFDRPTQQGLFEALTSLLEPTGYLFSGHSENLHWLTHILEPLGHTIHRPTGAAAAKPRLASLAKATAPEPPAPFVPNPAAEVAITAGGLHASAKGEVVRTLLGSCVAVCLYDPVARIGGMNHFMLPDGESSERNPAAFGVHAIELLVNAMMKLGGDRRRFVAKVFGASELPGRNASVGVATRNAAFSIEFLESDGIKVVAQKLGGTKPLSVRFETDSGRVLVREVENSSAAARVDASHVSTLEKTRRHVEEDITFFGAS
ncbi:Chemotaxis protein methyltransferase CheR [Labilithrix luteola]|uniref:Probable chemoreceptor glutamine deamidase CheD n=1 Tax=Labilithrix luteola TaxID=1391654 RepID=A0A0K1PKJ6_9BACT|nr:CheR family methyltransferase [Labilithrix luteola]AKU94042.1 Chemotaxis protein methyltransferase CheR [Labilithrix luteola]